MFEAAAPAGIIPNRPGSTPRSKFTWMMVEDDNTAPNLQMPSTSTNDQTELLFMDYSPPEEGLPQSTEQQLDPPAQSAAANALVADQQFLRQQFVHPTLTTVPDADAVKRARKIENDRRYREKKKQKEKERKKENEKLTEEIKSLSDNTIGKNENDNAAPNLQIPGTCDPPTQSVAANALVPDHQFHQQQIAHPTSTTVPRAYVAKRARKYEYDRKYREKKKQQKDDLSDRLRAENEKLRAENEKLRDEIGQLRDCSRAENEKSRDLIDRLRAENEKLGDEIGQLRDQNDHLRRRNKNLKLDNDPKLKIIDQLTASVQNLSQKLLEPEPASESESMSVSVSETETEPESDLESDITSQKRAGKRKGKGKGGQCRVKEQT